MGRAECILQVSSCECLCVSGWEENGWVVVYRGWRIAAVDCIECLQVIWAETGWGSEKERLYGGRWDNCIAWRVDGTVHVWVAPMADLQNGSEWVFKEYILYNINVRWTHLDWESSGLEAFVVGLGAVFQNLWLTRPVPEIICSFSCHSSPFFILSELTAVTHHNMHTIMCSTRLHSFTPTYILNQSQAGLAELARQPRPWPEFRTDYLKHKI